MICPVCGEKLRAIERTGIEIDLCPGCKGVWLDRGELEKLIAMEGGDVVSPQPSRAEQPIRSQSHDHKDKDHDRQYGEHQREHGDARHGASQKGRSRKSWLGDLLGGLGGDD